MAGWVDDQELPEEFLVPQGLPNGRPVFEIDYIDSKRITSSHLSNTMQIGNLNAFLSVLYAALAQRANRINYLQAMHNLVNPKPQGSLEALKVNVNSSLVLFENALVIIESRMETPELFVMPDRLRDHLMAMFCLNKKYPVHDVTCLYQSITTAALPQHTRNLPLPEYAEDQETINVLSSNLPLTEYTRNLRTIDVLSSGVDSTSSRISALSSRLREYVSLCELQLEDPYSAALLAEFLEMNIEDSPALRKVLARVEFTHIVTAADASDPITGARSSNLGRCLLFRVEHLVNCYEGAKLFDHQ